MTAAICSGCGRPTDECCVGDGCVPVEDQEQPLVAADGVEPVPGSPVHAPVAASISASYLPWMCAWCGHGG